MSSPLQPEPEVHPVVRSKAPWNTLKAETYLLFLRLRELPKGVYDSLEEAWGKEECGVFAGGLGAIMIVRYSETPVGQYDELMLIPGNFTVPKTPNTPLSIPKKAMRIARIYVSQRTTTYNGRLNWNIPKHLARFSFSAPPTPQGSSPPESLTVRVYPPDSADGDGTAPFFACTLTPFKWLPAMPINSKYVPLDLTHVQPACPEREGRLDAVRAEVDAAEHIDPYDISLKHEAALAVGTERWCAFGIGAKAARARGCWVEMAKIGEGEHEEGRWWPGGVVPWSFGAWMEGAELEIGTAVEWKL